MESGSVNNDGDDDDGRERAALQQQPQEQTTNKVQGTRSFERMEEHKERSRQEERLRKRGNVDAEPYSEAGSWGVGHNRKSKRAIKHERNGEG